MKSIFLLVISALFIKSCNVAATSAKTVTESSSKVVEQKSNTFFQENTSFMINEVSGKTVVQQQPTFYFEPEKNMVSGNSGCNSYSVEFNKTGEGYKFQYPMATKIFCEGSIEQTFFKALREIKFIEIEDSILLAKNAANEVILKGTATEK